MSSALTAARREALTRKARRKDSPFLDDLRRMRDRRRVHEYVTPKELAKVVAQRTGAPMHVVWPIVHEFMEVGLETVDSGKDLRLGGLGTIYWKKYPRRDGFKSRLTKETYNLPERVRLKWAAPRRFRDARPVMDKYGVKFDDEKVKEASKDEKPKSYVEDGAHCPVCGEDLDSGGACPTHGTEPLEKRSD